MRFDPKGGTLTGAENARFLTRGDEGECSLSVRPGTMYEARFWYRAPDPARVCPYSTGCAPPPAGAFAPGIGSLLAGVAEADGHGYRGEPIPPASEDEAPAGLTVAVGGVAAAPIAGTPYIEPRWSEHLAATRVWSYSPKIFSGPPTINVNGTLPTTWTAAATGFGGPLRFTPSAGVDRASFGLFLWANDAAQPAAPAKIGLDVDHFSFCRVPGSGTADDPVAVCAPDTPPAQ